MDENISGQNAAEGTVTKIMSLHNKHRASMLAMDLTRTLILWKLAAEDVTTTFDFAQTSKEHSTAVTFLQQLAAVDEGFEKAYQLGSIALSGAATCHAPEDVEDYDNLLKRFLEEHNKVEDLAELHGGVIDSRNGRAPWRQYCDLVTTFGDIGLFITENKQDAADAELKERLINKSRLLGDVIVNGGDQFTEVVLKTIASRINEISERAIQIPKEAECLTNLSTAIMVRVVGEHRRDDTPVPVSCIATYLPTLNRSYELGSDPAKNRTSWLDNKILTDIRNGLYAPKDIKELIGCYGKLNQMHNPSAPPTELFVHLLKSIIKHAPDALTDYDASAAGFQNPRTKKLVEGAQSIAINGCGILRSLARNFSPRRSAYNTLLCGYNP